MTYFEALKVWNAKSNQQWCSPRKGTPQYNAVMRIMKGESIVYNEVHAIEKKQKKPRKSMKVDLK